MTQSQIKQLKILQTVTGMNNTCQLKSISVWGFMRRSIGGGGGGDRGEDTPENHKQVAKWATIAHLGASIMFGDTIIYDAQRQETLNLKQ